MRRILSKINVLWLFSREVNPMLDCLWSAGRLWLLGLFLAIISLRMVSISRINNAKASSKLNEINFLIRISTDLTYVNVAKSTWIFAPLIIPSYKRYWMKILFSIQCLPIHMVEIEVALNMEYMVFSIQLRILSRIKINR